ncbi:MAG TPA: hypothetical protein VFU97_24385 [Xanthobacteraceae bacterium]|nr:hypothetical protein [Xanthobacteraceae bacterium]
MTRWLQVASMPHRHRPAGTGSIARKRLASGRMRFETHAPATDGQRRGKSLGTFDTEREAEEAIAEWIRTNRGAA